VGIFEWEEGVGVVGWGEGIVECEEGAGVEWEGVGVGLAGRVREMVVSGGGEREWVGVGKVEGGLDSGFLFAVAF
jgi:hypothetical protein